MGDAEKALQDLKISHICFANENQGEFVHLIAFKHGISMMHYKSRCQKPFLSGQFPKYPNLKRKILMKRKVKNPFSCHLPT